MKKIAIDYIIKKININKLLNTLLVIFNLFEFFNGVKIIFVRLLYKTLEAILFVFIIYYHFLFYM